MKTLIIAGLATLALTGAQAQSGPTTTGTTSGAGASDSGMTTGPGTDNNAMQHDSTGTVGSLSSSSTEPQAGGSAPAGDTGMSSTGKMSKHGSMHKKSKPMVSSTPQ